MKKVLLSIILLAGLPGDSPVASANGKQQIKQRLAIAAGLGCYLLIEI
jgi:hypothetical protein